MAATKVREIMTPDPRCVGTDDSLQKAADLMAADRVGALPICGQDGRLKGVLTDRDIVVRGLAAGKRLDETAGELNQGEAATVGADDSVDEAMATMVEKHVKRLPVIDGTTLVGMVTTGDVARALPDPDVGDLIEALSVG
ncbi:CBS domain-containing protein [Nocardiopsis xinjiangensis]|uniref:CBS domain-containing protein n=1 Tax=Nocardiopsis xinjiangensis TaxID=124285 RepID=UPI00037BC2E0|nr:CBS domain-containing protein [Nocardiopsis xinjiangensis]